MQENIKIAVKALTYLEEEHLRVAQVFQQKADELEDDNGPGGMARALSSSHRQHAKNMVDLKKILTHKPKKGAKKIEATTH